MEDGMKAKKCPVCGYLNKVSSTVCSGCKANILKVRITEENAEAAGSGESAVSGTGSGDSAAIKKSSAECANTGETVATCKSATYLKRCPSCGMTWPYATAKCNSCGTSLAGQRPIRAADVQKPVSERTEQTADHPAAGTSPAVETEKKKVLFTLRSEDGLCEIYLSEGDEVVIGRSGAGADYLKEKSFVSGRHASVEVKNGEIIITHIGKTNPTLVNKKAITPEIPYLLNAGDLIELGAREGQGFIPNIGYFRVVQ